MFQNHSIYSGNCLVAVNCSIVHYHLFQVSTTSNLKPR